MSERDVQDSLKFMREKLRKERKAQNMSQLTLSAEADLACNTICRIEKGTAEPGIGNLLRLTDALHIPMSELFPQGEGPKAKEIGIIDDAQLQEIISLWHKIPGEARGSAYVMIKIACRICLYRPATFFALPSSGRVGQLPATPCWAFRLHAIYSTSLAACILLAMMSPHCSM